MSELLTAIVIGATGLTGRALVAQLARDARYTRVIACVRKPTEFEARVVTHRVDFDALIKSPEAFVRSFAKLDITPTIHAFCCLGTTIKAAGSQEAFRCVDFDSVVACARAMKSLDVAHFGVISALGAARHSRVFYSRTKGEMEAAVIALGMRSTHIVRPSFLDGKRSEQRFGERIGIVFTHALGPVLRGPLRRYRVVHVDAVAATLIRHANAGRDGLHITESEAITR